jgi:hypothetical protein
MELLNPGKLIFSGYTVILSILIPVCKLDAVQGFRLSYIKTVFEATTRSPARSPLLI